MKKKRKLKGRVERKTRPYRGKCTCFPTVYFDGVKLGRRIHDTYESCKTR